MLLLSHFFLGMITSFTGMIAPSMLNMMTVKITTQHSRKMAMQFAFGVTVVVLPQASLAVLFTAYLRENAVFIVVLQKVSAVIFLILSVYFWTLSRKEKRQETVSKPPRKNTFWSGIALSFLNMFSIPFYCGVTTSLDALGWFSFQQAAISWFVIGSAIGTLLLLFVYASFAKRIMKKATILSKNMNLILSILTGVLGVFTLISVYF